MPTRLPLTLTLILLAALIAAAAIALLLASPSWPTGREPGQAPTAELRVVAPGYKDWALIPRGGGGDKIMRGPVRLVPEK